MIWQQDQANLSSCLDSKSTGEERVKDNSEALSERSGELMEIGKNGRGSVLREEKNKLSGNLWTLR